MQQILHLFHYWILQHTPTLTDSDNKEVAFGNKSSSRKNIQKFLIRSQPQHYFTQASFCKYFFVLVGAYTSLPEILGSKTFIIVTMPFVYCRFLNFREPFISRGSLESQNIILAYENRMPDVTLAKLND